MDKTQAKIVLSSLLCEQVGGQFHFECMCEGALSAPSIHSDMWNLTFPMAVQLEMPWGEVQVSIEFLNDWIDVLAFPHPRIIEKDCVVATVRFINCLNNFVKLQNTNGRFYVDEHDLDVAYSARINYRYLEFFPKEAVDHGVLGCLRFVADIAIPLYQVGHGEMTYEEGRQYISDLWRN